MPGRQQIDHAIAETVVLTMIQIKFDIVTGVVPPTVHSFSELHDYVDANCYGGLCDEPYAHREVFTFDDEGIAHVAAVQEIIDVWLKVGRP